MPACLSFPAPSHKKYLMAIIQRPGIICPWQTVGWNDFVELLKQAWLNQVAIDSAQLQKITCPVLIAGGDKDQYNSVEGFVKQYRLIPHSSLAIIPNCDHIIFYRRPGLMEKLVMDFVK